MHREERAPSSVTDRGPQSSVAGFRRQRSSQLTLIMALDGGDGSLSREPARIANERSDGIEITPFSPPARKRVARNGDASQAGFSLAAAVLCNTHPYFEC